MEMAADVVAGVSCTRIGLSLLRLLSVGDGREEESKSRTMKNPFMGGLGSAMPCQCFLRLALSLKANRRTLPLFDDELIVLVFLTSFPRQGVVALSIKDLFHNNGRFFILRAGA
jgi:hypothetical protein